MPTATLQPHDKKGTPRNINIGGVVFRTNEPKPCSVAMARRLKDDDRFRVDMEEGEAVIEDVVADEEETALSPVERAAAIREVLEDLDPDLELDALDEDGVPTVSYVNRFIDFEATAEEIVPLWAELHPAEDEDDGSAEGEDAGEPSEEKEDDASDAGSEKGDMTMDDLKGTPAKKLKITKKKAVENDPTTEGKIEV